MTGLSRKVFPNRVLLANAMRALDYSCATVGPTVDSYTHTPRDRARAPRLRSSPSVTTAAAACALRLTTPGSSGAKAPLTRLRRASGWSMLRTSAPRQARCTPALWPEEEEMHAVGHALRQGRAKYHNLLRRLLSRETCISKSVLATGIPRFPIPLFSP